MEQFIGILQETDMIAANTWYDQRPERQCTYREPGAGWTTEGKSWVLDYWLVARRWRNMVRSVYSDTSTGLPSDHAPLILELEGRFAVKQGHSRRQWKIDWAGVTPETRQKVSEKVAAAREERKNNPEDILMQAAKECLLERPAQARRPWIGAITWALAEKTC